MDQGTKLGKDELEVTEELSLNETKETSGTKLGELSDFEKQLSTTDSDVASEETVSEVVLEPINQENESRSSQDLSFEQALNDSMLDFQEGDIVKGQVRSIEKAGAFIDISYKSDGFLPNSEYSFNSQVSIVDELKDGDYVDVCIDKLETKNLPLPHIGWNEIKFTRKNNYDFVDKKSFYFIHSFVSQTNKATSTLAFTNYEGLKIPAIIQEENITGFQFHPEKSHYSGLKLIKLFLNE